MTTYPGRFSLRIPLLRAPGRGRRANKTKTERRSQNARLIRKSLVLPFQFRTALDAIEQASALPNRRKVIEALSRAVDLALANVPRFEGHTLIALDSSGSMAGRPMKIGSLFAAVLFKTNDADLMLFSDDARWVTLNKADSTLTLAQRMEEKRIVLVLALAPPPGPTAFLSVSSGLQQPR